MGVGERFWVCERKSETLGVWKKEWDFGYVGKSEMCKRKNETLDVWENEEKVNKNVRLWADEKGRRG